MMAMEAAQDEEGAFREVNRHRPKEVKGLKLVPLTFEIEHILEFEGILTSALLRETKLLSSYFTYETMLNERGRKMSQYEFEYIKMRLNSYN